MMIIFLVLVIVGVVYFINNTGRKERYSQGGFLENFVPGKNVSSLEILKKRYAEGEITLDEYEEMKNTILEEEEYYE